MCRIDELYAFFIQWSPNIEADAEGFVVVNENICSHLSETSLNEPQLLRTASISKDWEVLFHCLSASAAYSQYQQGLAGTLSLSLCIYCVHPGISKDWEVLFHCLSVSTTYSQYQQGLAGTLSLSLCVYYVQPVSARTGRYSFTVSLHLLCTSRYQQGLAGTLSLSLCIYFVHPGISKDWQVLFHCLSV